VYGKLSMASDKRIVNISVLNTTVQLLNWFKSGRGIWGTFVL
jgi:hypothetical protein